MDNNKRRIAALALFRSLYNEGRSDVMTILCEFAKDIVIRKHLTEFTPTQIKNELKLEYEFYIPEYVVESVLKKFCRKENSKYYPKEGIASKEVNMQEIEKIEQSHEIILSRLVAFVESKTSKKLEDEEIRKLFQSLCRFLIEESDVAYEEYISAFIIDIQKDADLSKLLRTIKEGVVLYTGIQYNDNISEVGSWKNDYTIYLEQEILFHMVGYNGELYKQLFKDFYDLIKEINLKAHKQLIKVKYFDSVRIEIEKFFNTAERIIDGKETLDYSNIAMTTILQGCEHKTDVIAKKCEFFDFLSRNLISEENGGSFNDESSKYNIFHKENIEQLTEAHPKRDIEPSLKLLNYVSQIRKGNMSGFENSICILLTGNSTTMAVAFDPLIKQNGDVPLATTLDYITNKLWFKMNKGFGSNVYPKSFDIVTKAQIILSAQIVGSVATEYEKIKKEILEKKKPESVIIAELAELKTKVRKPEDVQVEEIDDVLSTISLADTERYLREREMERAEAEEQRKENERLQSEVEDIKLKNKKAEEENNYYKERLAKSKNQTIEQIDNQINDIREKQTKADAKVKKRIKRVRWIPWTVIVLFILIVGYGTYKYGWERIESVTWIVPTIIASIPYLVFAIGARSINPQNIINKKYKKWYKEKIYTKYGVNLEKKKALEKQKKDVEESMS